MVSQTGKAPQKKPVQHTRNKLSTSGQPTPECSSGRTYKGGHPVHACCVVFTSKVYPAPRVPTQHPSPLATANIPQHLLTSFRNKGQDGSTKCLTTLDLHTDTDTDNVQQDESCLFQGVTNRPVSWHREFLLEQTTIYKHFWMTSSLR